MTLEVVKCVLKHITDQKKNSEYIKLFSQKVMILWFFMISWFSAFEHLIFTTLRILELCCWNFTSSKPTQVLQTGKLSADLRRASQSYLKKKKSAPKIQHKKHQFSSEHTQTEDKTQQCNKKNMQIDVKRGEKLILHTFRGCLLSLSGLSLWTRSEKYFSRKIVRKPHLTKFPPDFSIFSIISVYFTNSSS